MLKSSNLVSFLLKKNIWGVTPGSKKIFWWGYSPPPWPPCGTSTVLSNFESSIPPTSDKRSPLITGEVQGSMDEIIEGKIALPHPSAKPMWTCLFYTGSAALKCASKTDHLTKLKHVQETKFNLSELEMGWDHSSRTLLQARPKQQVKWEFS